MVAADKKRVCDSPLKRRDRRAEQEIFEIVGIGSPAFMAGQPHTAAGGFALLQNGCGTLSITNE
jgi:hypothetical protein